MTKVAQCPECGKRYKVPHFDKAWQCKACQVPLDRTGLEMDAPVAVDEHSTCPACGFEVEGGARECSECGEVLLGAHHSQVSGVAGSRLNSKVRTQIHKQYKKLLLVRMTVIAGVLFCLYSIGIDVSRILSGFHFTSGLSHIGLQILMISLLWGAHWGFRYLGGEATRFSILLMIMYGAFAWDWASVTEVAVLWTVVAIYAHAVFVLRNIRTLQGDHPGVFDAPNSSSRRASEPRRAYMGEQKRWQHLAGYGMLILGMGLFFFAEQQKTPDEKLVSAFFEDWNGSDMNAIAALAGELSNDFYLEKLNEMDRERNWRGELPRMEHAKIYAPTEKTLTVEFDGPDGGLKTRFYFRRERWLLVALEYVPAP